jgi:glycosyltransferase involved in cell wall biosynthesis
VERHRIAIVIPALNECGTIASVVLDVAKYGLPIVVDDGSIDGTGELARAAGAVGVRHDVRRGYDEALNSGLAAANSLGCEYAISIDADGQHSSSTIAAFLESLDDGADVVVGVRDRRQRLSEQIFAYVGTLMWGIRDPLCGMKGYRLSVYRELGHVDCYRSIGTELAVFAARRGKRVAQLPVQTVPRSGRPRFGGRLAANIRIFRALWRTVRKSHSG